MALAVVFAWLCGVCAVDAKSKTRPNILFILADDLGWKDLSNEGSTSVSYTHLTLPTKA